VETHLRYELAKSHTASMTAPSPEKLGVWCPPAGHNGGRPWGEALLPSMLQESNDRGQCVDE